MNSEKLLELCKLNKKLADQKVNMRHSRPRMTKEQKSFAEELYKAHFTPTEAAKWLSFGYGSVVSLWQSFKYAKVKKYNRFNLIIGRHFEDINVLIQAAFAANPELFKIGGGLADDNSR